MQFRDVPIDGLFTIEHESAYIGNDLVGYVYQRIDHFRSRFVDILADAPPGRHPERIGTTISFAPDFVVTAYPKQVVPTELRLIQGAA